MMVMVSNNSCFTTHFWARKFPGRIGWLMGPASWKKPRPYLPYALDNDAFSSWKNHQEWNQDKWLELLEKASECAIKPIWCLVPDVVANKRLTLANWGFYAPIAFNYGFKLAFAVQNGMKPCDVPRESDVVFVGGTTQWKWESLPTWVKHFPRVHVGRVLKTRLLTCENLGVESVDSTGWFRGTPNGQPALYLKAWLEGHIKPHPEFDFSPAVVLP